MRKSALATRDDSQTQYLFFPEKVVGQSFTTIQNDITKHKLALQKNKHTQIWMTLCETLHQKRNNDPRNLVHACQSKVVGIREELANNKKSYPYLNGSKMCDYWMFIMSHHTDIILQDRHMLSIIPDTHIQQASIKLGLTTIQDTPEQVKQKRFDLLHDTGIYPADLHSMLWNWSRNNFTPNV